MLIHNYTVSFPRAPTLSKGLVGQSGTCGEGQNEEKDIWSLRLYIQIFGACVVKTPCLKHCVCSMVWVPCGIATVTINVAMEDLEKFEVNQQLNNAGGDKQHE